MSTHSAEYVCTVVTSMERLSPEEGDYLRCGNPAVAFDPVMGFPMCEFHATQVFNLPGSARIDGTVSD